MPGECLSAVAVGGLALSKPSGAIAHIVDARRILVSGGDGWFGLKAWHVGRLVPPLHLPLTRLAALLALCSMCSPSGTWANATLTEATTSAKGCSLCPSGTYRTGDAAPENNACRRIPPGGQNVEAAWSACRVPLPGLASSRCRSGNHCSTPLPHPLQAIRPQTC